MQFQTGHPVYRTVLPRSRYACRSASAVEGNRSIDFTTAAGAVGKDGNSVALNRIKTQRSGFDPERRCDEMSEKWLLSRCEGYAVRIDEVSAKLQAPVIVDRTKVQHPRKHGVWGARPTERGQRPKLVRPKPQPVFAYFLLAQKVGRTRVRNIFFV